MRPRDLAIELSAMLGLGLLLATLGPFGTGAMPIGWRLIDGRLIDWPVFLLGGYLCFRPVVAAGLLLAAQGAVPGWFAIGLACGLAAFPATPLVAWTLAGNDWRQVGLGRLVRLYPEILLIGAVATLVQLGLRDRRRQRAGVEPGVVAEPAALPVATSRPAFLDRLPASLRGDLLCLQNEDHYVRAHTGSGSALILMRLGDAVAERDGIEGARTHRSWWVARGAVSAVVRRERSVSLRLRNGLDVLVARAMLPQLRADGWLSGLPQDRAGEG